MQPAINTKVRLNRILGMIYGQALGDAFGLSTEFMDERTVHATFGTDNTKMIPFPVTKYMLKTPHSRRWLSGDWTDDTDQMLLIIRSLLNNDMKVVERDFARKLYDWMREGFPECGDNGGMGIGATVYSVLTHHKFLDDPVGVAQEVWEKGGRNLAANGAVMRTSILGAVDSEDLNKVIQNTTKICNVTHADPRCVASCIAITVPIALILQGRPIDTHEQVLAILEEGRTEALNALERLNAEKQWIDEFNEYFDAPSIDALRLDESSAIGYTYKCFACGIYALRNLSDPNYNKDYKLLFNEIAFKGGDSDTNLAVAGAMTGVYLGLDKLDKEWIKAFPHAWFIEHLAKTFCTQGLLFDNDQVTEVLSDIRK